MNLQPWHEDAWNKLSQRIRDGKLAHALLIAGSRGLGKRSFAENAAALLLCEQGGVLPCGKCRSCRLFAVRSQRDPEETRPDETRAHPDGHPGHPDVRFVGFALNEKSSPKKMYTELVVEQIRDLSAWLSLPPQFGRALVAIIDPADALNPAAANALLKTLEEPGADRHLILVASQPMRLPATIRSRCQRIELPLPSTEQGLHWLATQGVQTPLAAAALQASGGTPGLALEWAKSGGMSLREEVAADLSALDQGKVAPSDVANRWSRDQAEVRLWFAAALVNDEARARANGSVGPLALTSRADFTKLAAWFDRANRARQLLRTPLRPELVLLDVLSAAGDGRRL